MNTANVIVIDDDADIRDVLNLTLTQEGYEVREAENGEEGLKAIQAQPPDIVIVDYNMPRMDGASLCVALKKDILLSHLPIIMLTGKSDVLDKVSGINAGADDYIVKPFEPQELLARIRMILRRSSRDLDANPLTRLPGNVSILEELKKRIDNKEAFCVAYIDLDKFKVFNDKYGFNHGDQVIRSIARVLIRADAKLGTPNDFIGHIGGDDFVVITAPEKVDSICEEIIKGFDELVPRFYTEEDRKAGYITGKDRQGVQKKFGLLSVSIGVVSNEKRDLDHVAQIGEIGAELKEAAKQNEHSSYVKDKRT